MGDHIMKKLDLTKSSFEANGHTYTITDELSIARWREFENHQALVGLGRSFKEIFDNLAKAYEALNKGKVADAAVTIHNLLSGIKDKLDQRHHPALMMCALWINRKDEDTALYDQAKMEEKINDWEKEGYNVEDFFLLAWNFVPEFIETYKNGLESILNPSTDKKTTSKTKG
jgi:hypothetical protein